MRKQLLFTLLTICSITGCKKDSKTYPGLVNTGWELAAVWQGIGASDDGWHSVPADSQRLIFDKSGKGAIYYYGVPSRGYYYQLTGDSTIDSKGDSVMQTGHERYLLARDTLTIYGISCIEGCLSRYLRIRAID